MSKEDQHVWCKTNSMLLLCLVELLEEQGILDKNAFLKRLATFREETIEGGLI
ncbi:MAG: hypothetical protein ETSY1_44480 [Candidatus Entotheonella factor]|uniref:Uncharacterized protein n=1 Tax=Entotheonella factor TaxID=1429438 RepID=W4L2X0_ENTF1|nr:MAG: hypothetical protein ETSY1_44480 [Candidatus Entotheonella factor]